MYEVWMYLVITAMCVLSTCDVCAIMYLTLNLPLKIISDKCEQRS